MLTYKVIAVATITCFLSLFYHNTFAQKKNGNATDTTEEESNNIFQFALKFITKKHVDSTEQAAVLKVKSETPFLRYSGKGIRSIIIKQYGFDRSFTDTSKSSDYFGTKLLNHLHRNTRDWVIRDNLFIKEGTELNPYIVAENERYLRFLEYIQDARIIVKRIPNQPDSVDLVVITKDLFSITGELKDLSPGKFRAKAGDANILGMGQKILVTTLWEKKRNPAFGYEVVYSKNNIANSFVDAYVGLTKLQPDLRDGSKDEHAWYISFDRPLISQYTHLAGNLTFGHNESYNNYSRPDSVFYKYHYNTFDAWAGYNLGIQKILQNTELKARQFVSLRYFRNKFIERPYQIDGAYNFRFDDRTALLAQFTFFKQNYYKANYIYGFGATEDVPTGYNVSLTTGFYKQADLRRFYAGIDGNRYVYTDNGHFIQYFLRTGGFLKNKGFEDASILAGTSMFSRLFIYDRVKIRQYLRFSYTKQFNRIALDPLKIDNAFGLRNFTSDSVYGSQRVSLHSETSFFLKYKFFGFKFAPFAAADISIIKPENEPFSKSAGYYGIGGGLRTRNENLIFGTIELRLRYVPRHAEGNTPFKIMLSANLRFRYNTEYVKAPEIIDVNNDADKNIY